jgi:hypothetical protein
VYETLAEDRTRLICGRNLVCERLSRIRSYTLRAVPETPTDTATLSYCSLVSLSPTQISSLTRELTGMLLYRDACTLAACGCAGVYVPQPCIRSSLVFAPYSLEHSLSHLLRVQT